MKNRYLKPMLILNLIIFFPVFLWGQKKTISIHKVYNSLTDPSFLIISSNKINETKNNFIYQLLDGSRIKDYSIYKYEIQAKQNPSKYDSISLLVGYIKPDLIMVADRNRNNVFTDDSVYKLSMLNHFKSDFEFRNAIPVVHIDSIKIIQEYNQITFSSMDLKFCPSSGSNDNFKDTSDISGLKQFQLARYSIGYYISDSFVYKGNKYWIKINPDPFIYKFYPLKKSRYSISTVTVLNHPHQNGFVSYGGITEMLLAKKTGIKFLDAEIILDSLDFKKSELTFTIQTPDSNTFHRPLPDLTKYSYYKIANKKYSKIEVGRKAFTVIEFSGSWCKPCIKIIPEMKEIEKTYSKKIDFITVLNEKDRLAAIRFYTKYALSKNTYFENIDCYSDTCLRKIFDIKSFPTILVVDKENQVLFNEIGDEAVEKLKFFLQKQVANSETKF